jgi:hypothetical protein
MDYESPGRAEKSDVAVLNLMTDQEPYRISLKRLAFLSYYRSE